MNKNQNNKSVKNPSEQRKTLEKFKGQEMKLFLGLNVLLRELSLFMGRGKSFEDLLTIGICGLLSALEECNSFDCFDQKIQKYGKLYLSQYIKNSDYCPKLMDVARDMLVNNISIAEKLKLGNSLQKFAKQKIDCLVQQHRTNPLSTRKAVYVSFIDTIINYPRGDCSKAFATPEAYMTSKIKHHLDFTK